MGIKAKISTPNKLQANIKPFAGGIGGKQQIYIGDEEPTDEEILIWIDTSGDSPIISSQLLTSDNKEFTTVNDEKFILKEE